MQTAADQLHGRLQAEAPSPIEVPDYDPALDEFQALGMEPGSRRVTAIPPVATLVGWAEGVLGSCSN